MKNACDVAMRKGRNERAKMKRQAQKEGTDMKIKKKNKALQKLVCTPEMYDIIESSVI